jgi:hypothetical protein
MNRRTQPSRHSGAGSLPATDPVTVPQHTAAGATPPRDTDLETAMHHIPEQMARSHMSVRHAEAQQSRMVRVAVAARRAAAAERRARMAREAAVQAARQAAVAAAR